MVHNTDKLSADVVDINAHPEYTSLTRVIITTFAGAKDKIKWH